MDWLLKQLWTIIYEKEIWIFNKLDPVYVFFCKTLQLEVYISPQTPILLIFFPHP